MNQVQRVLEILTMLQRGEEVSTTTLHDNRMDIFRNDISMRSIQDDMQYVIDFFGDALLKNSDNKYKLIDKDQLNKFLNNKYIRIYKYLHSLSVIDSPIFKKLDNLYGDLINYHTKKKIYQFLDDPKEDLKIKKELIKKIEKYITDRTYVDIEYEPKEKYSYKRVKPLKIIYSHENWYLASITSEDREENDGFRLLRIQYIASIDKSQTGSQTFQEDIKANIFLKNHLQTLFTSYVEKTYLVRVKVSYEIARFFKAKRFLKSQSIIYHVDPNIQKEYNFQKGDLLVEYHVNDDMEILPTIQKFLPHIKVIEPKQLHQKVLDNIQAYL